MRHIRDSKVPSAIAEMQQSREDHARRTPVAIFDLLREEDAARLLFDGLMKHYLECLGQKKMEIWAKAAHACVDLLAHPNTEIHSRATMAYGQALAKLEVMLRDVKLNPRIQAARDAGANI